VRLERTRIELLLNKTWAVSPSAAETLEAVSTAIDRLTKRLKVTERLDDLRRRLEDVSMTAPPTVTDGIDEKLQMAAKQIQPFALTDEDVGTANRLLDTAETSLMMLSDNDGLARLIATNFRDLIVRHKFLPYSYYSDLKAALPGLFEMLNQPFDDFRNIPHQMAFAVDYGIAALQMAFDYSVLRVNASAAPGGASHASAAGSFSGQGLVQSARERLNARKDELISLLGTISWPALRELRTLLQEMRENIYENDVLEELSTQGQAEIELDPRTVRPYVPVIYSIHFKDSRFNNAAALQRLICKWDFPGRLLEQDWKICHFFQGNEAKRGEGEDLTVSVRVESQKAVDSGAPMDGKSLASPRWSMLSTTIELHRLERPSYSRAFAEGVRFLIAFGVALAGLLTGALQQLDKLDFVPAMIAVLALGFGADTVKNLLTQTAKKAAA
jgi:hypothetical protein